MTRRLRSSPRSIATVLVFVAGATLSEAVSADALPDAGPASPAEVRARQAEGAADVYEAFARRNPSSPDGATALEDAVELRLELGQPERAAKDADALRAHMERTEPNRVARASLAIADYQVEQGNPEAARQRLTAWAASYEKGAPLALRIHANALAGRAALHTNVAAAAATHYARVVELWKDPALAEATVRAEGGDTRALVNCLNDVGEALFFAAEKQRKLVEQIHFPEYRGSGTREDVLTHMNTKVLDWVKRKRPAIESLEEEYKRIVDLKPAPPPKWVVRSASRVGQAWARFVAEFRASPIPKEWKGHGVVPGTTDLTYEELRASYFEKVDEASEPQKLTAKAAFKTCVAWSLKYQYADELTRSCDEWLSKNYPGEPVTP